MHWYYSKNSTQLGPVTQEELLSKLASGEVSRTDMVWREGMADWCQAASVPELSGSVGAQPANPVPTAVVQPTYGAPVSSQMDYTSIPNYLWQSIVVTIFCCWPLGIPAIVAAAKVDGLKARGDVHGAMAASAAAKKWCLFSVIAWGVVFVLYILVVVFATVFQANAPHGVR